MMFDELNKKVRFVVKATDYERVMGHMKVCPEFTWNRLGSQSLVRVGEFGGMPVTVNLDYYDLHGVIVVYADPQSRVVDYFMLDEFYEKTFPNFEAKPDVWNFHFVSGVVYKKLGI